MKKTLWLTRFLLALCLLLTALGCNNQPANPLVGKWSYEDSGTTTIWNFAADGNLIVSYNGTTLELKYTLLDADTVRISGVPDEESSADVDFVVNGDTMVMTIVDGGDSQEFKRAK